MPFQINILNFKINGAAQNGNVDIGPTVHNSHTANSKLQGINASYGDTSPTEAMMENLLNDPDVNDQTSIGTNDATNINKPILPVPPI
jgi:hypothetical protein